MALGLISECFRLPLKGPCRVLLNEEILLRLYGIWGRLPGVYQSAVTLLVDRTSDPAFEVLASK